MNWKRQNLRADLVGVYPPLLNWARKFQRECLRYDIPLFILEGMRTNERQKEVFDAGFSNIEQDGPHGRGMALDMVHGVKFWDGMSDQDWFLLSEIGKDAAATSGFKVEWGGDWGRTSTKVGWDAAHWQIPDWRNVPQVKQDWPTVECPVLGHYDKRMLTESDNEFVQRVLSNLSK